MNQKHALVSLRIYYCPHYKEASQLFAMVTNVVLKSIYLIIALIKAMSSCVVCLFVCKNTTCRSHCFSSACVNACVLVRHVQSASIKVQSVLVLISATASSAVLPGQFCVCVCVCMTCCCENSIKSSTVTQHAPMLASGQNFSLHCI